MRDTLPWNQMSPEQQNELFARMGECLHDSFTFARQLGIKTCIGTETPLTIPTPVKERLKAAGKDPADPAVVAGGLLTACSRGSCKTHPLDYYWFWTPEGWTWSGTKQEQIDATLADFRAAMAAAEKVKAPFTLATCGWVLGPQQDRACSTTSCPRTCPMSCINRQVGHAPVEPGFAKVKGRPKWAIPWMEDDPALISPQLWVGPDAQGRGRFAGLRLHRPDGHPLADADPGPERLGPGPGRLGSKRLEPGLVGPGTAACGPAAGRPGRRPARHVPAQRDRRHRRGSGLPDRPLRRRGATTWTCPTASTRSR